MGYYHILLSENVSNLGTIILPWKKYRHSVYQWELKTHQTIFQQKMNDLFHGFEFIRAYIDYLLIITKEDCTNHVQKLELTLNKINEK